MQIRNFSDSDSIELDPKSYCKCGNCVKQKTKVESFCCQETKYPKITGILNNFCIDQLCYLVLYLETCVLENPDITPILNEKVLVVNLR